MKKKYIIFAGVASAMLIISGFTFYRSVLHAGGMVFATGSPYDSGATCGQVGCHTGGATVPNVIITATPAFGMGNMYTPGLTYTINVTCSGSYPKYGFDLEILDSTSPTAALDQGVFGSPVTSNCQVIANAGLPTNMTHLVPSGSGNSATFSFGWTAPASGTAYIYCSGLGVNMGGTVGGDKVKAISMVLPPMGMGVAQLSKSKVDLKVSPNPVADKIKVTYFLDEACQVSIGLYSMNGESVSGQLIEYHSSGKQENDFFIPSELPVGIYFLKLTTDKGYFLKKIVRSK
jgi:hypothetical protein